MSILQVDKMAVDLSAAPSLQNIDKRAVECVYRTLYRRKDSKAATFGRFSSRLFSFFLNAPPLLFGAQASTAPGHALCQIIVADDYFPTAGAAAEPCSHRSSLGSRDGLYFPKCRKLPKCLSCQIETRLSI